MDNQAEGGRDMVAGGIRMDMARHKVTVDGKGVELTVTEFNILRFLLENRGRVVSRDRLLDAAWGENSFVEPRTVDVHIRRLRAKIEGDPDYPVHIKTIRGVGYTFAE